EAEPAVARQLAHEEVEVTRRRTHVHGATTEDSLDIAPHDLTDLEATLLLRLGSVVVRVRVRVGRGRPADRDLPALAAVLRVLLGAGRRRVGRRIRAGAARAAVHDGRGARLALEVHRDRRRSARELEPPRLRLPA